MKNKKGFTLIEVIAVIVIMGILVLIANPLVSSFIISSRKSSFASNASAFLESIKSNFDSNEYGEIDDAEMMVVPLSTLKLEKGSTTDSPFGKYDLERSYVLISSHNVSTGPAYKYQITLTDDSGHAIKEGVHNKLNKDVVEPGDKKRIKTIADIAINGYNCEVSNINCYEFLEKREVTLTNGEKVEVIILIKR